MNRKLINSICLFISLLFLITNCTGRKIESQLRRAEELKGTRKFEEALQLYKMIAGRYPGDEKAAVAILRMGDLYFYTFNEDESALSAYARVIEKWPFADQARQAALKRAEIFSARGEVRKAIGEHEWALKHFAQHEGISRVRLEVAEEYLQLNDPYQASVELEELLKDEHVEKNVRAKALFDLGESYLFLKKYDNALKAFDTLKIQFSDLPYILDAMLRMVECLEKMDRADEAIKLQEELVRQYPDSDLVKSKTEHLIKREEKVEKPDMR